MEEDSFVPRVLMIAAEPESLASGNNTSLARYEKYITKEGVDLRIIRVSDESRVGDVLNESQQFKPHVVHAYHIYYAGPLAARLATLMSLPLIVTAGGTDLDQDLVDDERAPLTRAVLDNACILLLPHQAQFVAALRANPDLKVLAIPKGVEPASPFRAKGREAFGVQDNEVLFALIGGIRWVKNNRFPLAPLAKLRAEGIPVRLIVAGPEREPAYTQLFHRELSRHPFASWVGTLLGDDLDSLYFSADVVLNVSHSEGGSNAVLEAMARGCCILASSIPGNEAFLKKTRGRAPAALFYLAPPSEIAARRLHDPDDFLAQARRLAISAEERQDLGREALWRATHLHKPEAEARAIVRAYRFAMEMMGRVRQEPHAQ